MVRSVPLALSVALLVVAAQAADIPLSAEAFEDYTTGYTVTFADRAGHAGQETYLENRRVRWADHEGVCTDGSWYGMGEMICFDYGEEPVTQCWWFYLEDYGLRAEYIDQSADSTLFETGRDDKPITCRQPGTDL